MRRTTTFLTLATVFALAVPSAAKGAFEATITGPGTEEPIVIEAHADLEALLTAVSFWDLTYTFTDSPHRPDGITMAPPTTDLGPEFVASVGHMGPGGDAYVDVYLYPEAAGYPLAYVEPGVEVLEMQESTSGGWYAVSADLRSLLEGYGFDVTRADSIPVTSDQSTAAWLAPVGLIVTLGVWAVGRRPRRPVTS